MKYGYIRVSNIGIPVNEQTELLLNAGCDRLFTDITRDANSTQGALADLLNIATSGDVIMVSSFDRLGGSLSELMATLLSLLNKGVHFVSLSDQLDTQNPHSQSFLKTLGALQNFEHSRLKEKNKIGLRSARARGKLGGRPRKMDGSKASMAKSLYKDKKHSIDDICNIMKVSRATLYRYLK